MYTSTTYVHIAAGLCRGVPLCRPHSCSLYGGHMDEFDTHGLSCRMSAGHLPWHAALNTTVKMSLARAQITSALEPVGLCQLDGKHPDGVTITPWQTGQTLV